MQNNVKILIPMYKYFANLNKIVCVSIMVILRTSSELILRIVTHEMGMFGRLGTSDFWDNWRAPLCSLSTCSITGRNWMPIEKLSHSLFANNKSLKTNFVWENSINSYEATMAEDRSKFYHSLKLYISKWLSNLYAKDVIFAGAVPFEHI